MHNLDRPQMTLVCVWLRALLLWFGLCLPLIGISAEPGDISLVSHRFDSVTTEANQGAPPLFASLSDDGRFVVYDGGNSTDIVSGTNVTSGGVYLYDYLNASNVLVNHVAGAPGTMAGPGGNAAISSDNRYVLFSSQGNNLVIGQIDTNNGADVFLLDRFTGLTTLVSHATGSQTTAANISSAPYVGSGKKRTSYPLSADGRYVVYISEATDLVNGVTDPKDGSDNTFDVFLYDRETGLNTLVSHVPGMPLTAMNCGSGDAVISGNGRFVAFRSCSTDLPGPTTGNGRDLFLFDRISGEVSLISHTPGNNNLRVRGETSGQALSISANGDYVVFLYRSTEIITGLDNQDHIFLYDRSTAQNTLVSHNSGSSTVGANRPSFSPAISSAGNFVVFASAATDLVSGLTYRAPENVYVYNRATGQNVLVSHNAISLLETGNGQSYGPSISSNGTFVAFASSATDIVAGQVDTNVAPDIFLYERNSNDAQFVSHASGSLLTAANADSLLPEVSADGDFVAWYSAADNHVNGQTGPTGRQFNLFLYDKIGIPDTTPNTFAFTDANNVLPSAVIESNVITVSGIDRPTEIEVLGGEYRIGSGTFTTVKGTVLNGQQVAVRHTSATAPNAITDTTLTIGGISDTFSSTTRHDTSPDSFVFTDQANVPINREMTSNAIRVSGISTPIPIGVAGGTYRIDGGAFTTAAGMVGNGQLVQVRHTSSSFPNQAVSTTLTVGTEADAKSDTFSSTTGLLVQADTAPNAFAFSDQTDVALAATVTSNEITTAGINASTAIGVSGGSYSVDGGPFITYASTINNGQKVRVQHASSASLSTATNTTLTIGGINDTFTSTTITVDETPDQFSFVDQDAVKPDALIISGAVTINGINAPVAISVSGGEYSIGGGGFGGAAGMVAPGDPVRVRHRSSMIPNTATTTTLTIGGVSDGFTSTTAPNSGVVTAPGNIRVQVTSAVGTTLSNLQSIAAPAAAPSGFTYPYGFFDFVIGSLPANGIVTVTYLLPPGVTPNRYIKCQGVQNANCSTLAGVQFGRDANNNNIVTLTLVNNGAGDSDTNPATITDPGAPALAAGGGTTSGGDNSGGGSCFIATAAYGSYWDPHVMTLRRFRDEVLLKSDAGRVFVATYYAVSPPVADFIRQREWLKAAVRVGLMPIVMGIEHPNGAFGILVMMLVGGLATRNARKWGNATSH